jgi:hypothetical protein
VEYCVEREHDSVHLSLVPRMGTPYTPRTRIDISPARSRPKSGKSMAVQNLFNRQRPFWPHYPTSHVARILHSYLSNTIFLSLQTC